MNNEYERIWKEAVVAQCRYYPGIFLERPIKTAPKSVREAGVQAKNRTKYLQNMNIKYLYLENISDLTEVKYAAI
jgi:hypothetical protein